MTENPRIFKENDPPRFQKRVIKCKSKSGLEYNHNAIFWINAYKINAEKRMVTDEEVITQEEMLEIVNDYIRYMKQIASDRQNHNQ